MQKTTVYFTDFKTTPSRNILKKLRELLLKSGIKDIDFENKFVALKIHFGEPGNMSYIRPNYAAVVANLIKELGGIPFLTDSNTLYKGRRSDAVRHTEAAFENGFSPFSTGTQVVIADGLKGTDFEEIHIDKEHCKTAKIGSAIANADIVISLNHFKGHEMAGFGGAIKNLGMGSGSIQGKMEMHSDSHPKVESEKCVGCKICEKNCAHNAIHIKANKISEIDYDLCVGCGQCIAVCQYESAVPQWDSVSMQEKMAEYAFAATKDKPHFHINFIMDVSPNCDCWPNNDIPVVPNIGIAASFDPVAIDHASIDMVNAAPEYKGSLVEGKRNQGDTFQCVHPNTDWKKCLNYAEKIGLGNNEYELKEMP